MRIAPNTVGIITYHGVVDSQLPMDDWCFISESSFRKHVEYLSTNFHVVHLSEALDMLEQGMIVRPTIVVTFDDGFQNNYDIAFPILCEFGVPATIFLSTGFIDTNDTIWFCRINHALGITKETVFEWKGCRYPISDVNDKGQTSTRIQEELKRLPHAQLIKVARDLLVMLGDDPDTPIHFGSPYRMLNGESIKEMSRSKMIEFGAHTHSHAILNMLSSQDKKQEITSSIQEVSQLTGKSCDLFAYPNGRSQDFDDECIEILKSQGVRAAVTLNPGPNSSSTSSWIMCRYGIHSQIDLAHFQCVVHNLDWFVRNKINTFLKRNC